MIKEYLRCIYLESEGNFNRILPVARKVIRARRACGLGPLHFSLFRLLSTPEPQWKAYLTNKSFYLMSVKGKYPVELQEQADNKSLFFQHCLQHGLPTIPIIGMVGQPPTQLAHGVIPAIEDVGHLESIIGAMTAELFVKPIDASHGDGAFLVRREGSRYVYGHDDLSGSVEDLYRHLVANAKDEGALLIQPRLRPHPEMARVSSPHGLATARIVTVSRQDGASVFIASAKLSVGASITDNFSDDGSTGNLVAAIDISTGTLSEASGTAHRNWPVMRSTRSHPDTGENIPGYRFPCWSDVLDVALRAQNSFPEIKSIGWDIAPTSEGVVIVEANCGYGIEIHEIAHRRGIGPELLSAMGS